ncbi:hypothetical protein PYR71_28410 [Rhizobium sp. MC63]|uniref:Uncharacterized protein n=4 Tax=Rhizobium TaxID=379 RepID=A0A3S0SDG2_9HYPH|nr:MULTISPECIES: hypothetical protein [Rhizobium]MEB3047574.1 hypothetical protein [Rhizobium sp. MJ21]MCJ9692676.1 hypothetical protein [Rhizobium sp. PRIMUS64]MDC7746772.1 hypothetical protein [Rhizobium sp. BC56]MDC9813391.1 hypothetical protein [Rhizobium sp. MC62]MDC9837611.1 hypothetical protein [Rhizobium sp. MJ37]
MVGKADLGSEAGLGEQATCEHEQLEHDGDEEILAIFPAALNVFAKRARAGGLNRAGFAGDRLV